MLREERTMQAKFDIFAVSPQGYEVHISLENEHVYTEALLLLTKLEEDGFRARGASRSPVEGQGTASNGQEHLSVLSTT